MVDAYINRRAISVGIATRNGLDVPGIQSRWQARLSHPSRPALGPTQPPIQWVPALPSGKERTRRGIDKLPRLAPRLKKEECYTSNPPLGRHGIS
jgi:hypothetical protein